MSINSTLGGLNRAGEIPVVSAVTGSVRGQSSENIGRKQGASFVTLNTIFCPCGMLKKGSIFHLWRDLFGLP